jgi:RNase P/RNase MRP subunit p29
MRNYNIHPKYLIYHDLIGFKVYIKPKSRKKENYPFIYAGIIIDDTENMINVKNTQTQVKKYIKKNFIFRIKIPKKTIDEKSHMLEIDGSKIVGRPENRLRHLKKKKRFRK